MKSGHFDIVEGYTTRAQKLLFSAKCFFSSKRFLILNTNLSRASAPLKIPMKVPATRIKTIAHLFTECTHGHGV